jgi:two-component system response regulator PilR (NtrC family)
VPPTGSILIVDDERSMRDFLRIALSRAGHEVVVADSPASAAAAFRARDFDVVVTDLKMSGGSGLDVLAGVKAARPRRRSSSSPPSRRQRRPSRP